MATGKAKFILGMIDMPPFWTLGAIAAILATSQPAWGIRIDIPGASIAGWLLIGASMGLIVWSAIWFRRKRTPIEPHKTPLVLIVEGPFRISRNPIYLSFVGLAIGVAVSQGAPLGILIGAVLWQILERRFVRREEIRLLRTFGQVGQEYLSQTRRWI